MASYKESIDIAFKNGKITKDIAERIKASEDPELAIDSVLTDLSRQKREAAIQAVRLSEAWDNMSSHPGGLYEGLLSLFTKDPKKTDQIAKIIYAVLILLMAGQAGGNAASYLKKASWLKGGLYGLKSAIKGKEVHAIFKDVIADIGG